MSGWEQDKLNEHRAVFLFGLFCVIAFCVLFWPTTEPYPKTPPAPQRIIRVCNGCGTKWRGEDTGPITKCPRCPLSQEDLERLKQQMLNQKQNNKQEKSEAE